MTVITLHARLLPVRTTAWKDAIRLPELHFKEEEEKESTLT